jgi:hypothetical protein
VFYYHLFTFCLYSDIFRLVGIIIIIIITIIHFCSPSCWIFTFTYVKQIFFEGIQLCDYSVVTVYSAYGAISNIKSLELLHQYFSKYVFSDQYGCFL